MVDNHHKLVVSVFVTSIGLGCVPHSSNSLPNLHTCLEEVILFAMFKSLSNLRCVL